MAKKDQKISKRRLRSSYLTTIISISLVLFVMGIIGLLLLNARKLSRHVKENIGFTVVLKDNTKEVDMIRLQKQLDASAYIKTTEYITKEQAAENWKKELGEDFVDFLGYNPLLPSIEVKLFAEYANPDSLLLIEKELQNKPQIKEIAYERNLVEIINNNVQKISLVLFAFSVMLLLISISLINNTVRLSVYARRFIIKTMQLVGATKGFVRTPFIVKSLIHTIYSVIIAYIMLGGVIYMINRELPEILLLNDIDTIAILYSGIFLVGLLIVWLSTWFAVNRYLRLKSNELYY